MVGKTFICQRCNTPIVLDETLLNLSPAQLNLLINRNHNHANDVSNQEILDSIKADEYLPKDRLKMYHEANRQGTTPINYHSMIESEDDEDDDNVQSIDKTTSEKDSYILVSDEEDAQDVSNGGEDINTISSRIKSLSKIFEILSQNSDIEHPLSADCANLLIENYKLKFDQSQVEKDNYVQFLKKLKDRDRQVTAENNEGINGKDPDDLDAKLNESIAEFSKLSLLEKEKLEELKQLEATNVELQEQLQSNRRELKEIEENELGSLLKLKNKLQLDLDLQHNKLEQSKASYKMHLDHLDKLRNLNIYSKIFNISFGKNDKYGSINGFRLGYKIVWPEVNAALGQIVHLLVFLFERLKLKLTGYKLIPMGSQSYIIKLNEEESEDEKPGTILNLFSSNEFSLGKLFNFNKLDVSMIALLDIVSHIEAKLTAIDGEFELPYHLSPKKGLVGGKSIRASSNSEWTQSCKFLLIDLNWILAWTGAHSE